MVTHAHAAEPDSRNFQVAFSKFALLHFFSSLNVGGLCDVIVEGQIRASSLH
jgi:hypothetical protein